MTDRDMAVVPVTLDGLRDVFERPFDGPDDPRIRCAIVLTRAEAEAVLDFSGDFVQALANRDATGSGSSAKADTDRDAEGEVVGVDQLQVIEGGRDAARYRRLRILGCAIMDTPQLASGTVTRFQNLDALLDADMDAHPSRGEAAFCPPDPAEVQALVESIRRMFPVPPAINTTAGSGQ